jgi:hypothetical protein
VLQQLQVPVWRRRYSAGKAFDKGRNWKDMCDKDALFFLSGISFDASDFML